MSFSVGQELDGLEFVRVLRPSKRSVAYIVRDVVSERLEYLKLVPEHLQKDDEAYQRFLREAKVHAGLSHPNIAQFYSVRRLGGELVMTREWIEGDTLASKITDGPLKFHQAADYLGQVLDALENAHGQGVIHRDITPENLLITESGIVKLTGFDLARSPNDPRLTGTGVVMGNVHYMAPEQVKGLAEAEARSDLYACGVVLFETVTGERPFERPTDFDVMLAQVEDTPPSPRKLNPLVTPTLEQVILRALAKEPNERFQTAAEFHAALIEEADASFQRSLHSPAEPPPQPESPLAETPPPPQPVQTEPELESRIQAVAEEVETRALGHEFDPESGDLSRMVGFGIACFSVAVLFFLGGMILLGH